MVQQNSLCSHVFICLAWCPLCYSHTLDFKAFFESLIIFHISQPSEALMLQPLLGNGWQRALCFCWEKTPKATKAAQQCFLLRMSQGRHPAFILKSYQMRGKLCWGPGNDDLCGVPTVSGDAAQWSGIARALRAGGCALPCSSPWLFLSISFVEQSWSSHWICWQAAQPAQPSLGTNQILLTASQIHVHEKAKLFPTPLAIALSLLGSLPCLI